MPSSAEEEDAEDRLAVHDPALAAGGDPRAELPRGVDEAGGGPGVEAQTVADPQLPPDHAPRRSSISLAT